MCGIVASSPKQDVLEMMSSICYYYNELLYCQSFQVRLEVNRRTLSMFVLSIVLKSAGTILALDISKYVKQFIVALQIYMSDVNSSVKTFCCELFEVIVCL